MAATVVIGENNRLSTHLLRHEKDFNTESCPINKKCYYFTIH